MRANLRLKLRRWRHLAEHVARHSSQRATRHVVKNLQCLQNLSQLFIIVYNYYQLYKLLATCVRIIIVTCIIMFAANNLLSSCHRTTTSKAAALLSAIVTKSSPSTSSSYQQPSVQLPQTSQQFRFVRKTFRFRFAYGERPLYTDHMYKEALEADRLEELSYKQIRFAAAYETNSPLQDHMVEKYIKYIMFDGRRGLTYGLLHKTFYDIKTIQYRRMLKKKATLAGAAAEAKKDKALKKKKMTTTTTNQPVEQEQEEENEGDQVNEIELNPVALFHKAIENCSPLLVTRKVKRGGAVYHVPYPITAAESEFTAIRWLNDTIVDRPKPRLLGYHRELAKEVVEAAKGRGKVVKKKDDIHKLAQSNKAYAHYRWG